jgi:hypothetical protein
MAAKRQNRIALVARSLAIAAVIGLDRAPLAGQTADRVIAVTLDGLRWQEAFDGADRRLITGPRGGVADTAQTLARFWRADLDQRRLALFPFLWGTVARLGLLLGDSGAGGTFRVQNQQRFSYPGYNELFTGASDPRLDSNDKIPNPNVTVLEWLAERPGLGRSVEVFGSWDVFPFIFNAERSGLPINGDGLPFPDPRSPVEVALNEMTGWLPRLWASARLDAPTMAGALGALRSRQPRILTVLLGETDEWAHQGRYDLYLDAARRSDEFLALLWTTAQSLAEARGRTSLLISVDHGRGPDTETWTDHGREVPAADRIWMAVMGPQVSSTAELRRQSGTQGQFAATLARLVGEDWQTARPDAAPPLRLRP